MIVKKITPKDIGRAVGFELMKLRWKYGIRIKHAAHLSGIDVKRLDAAEVGRFAGWETTRRLLKLYDVDVHIELVPRSLETPPSFHKINK